MNSKKFLSATVLVCFWSTQVIGIMPAAAAVSATPLSVPEYIPSMTSGASAAQSAGAVALGATRGNFSVDDSGAAHYSVPLQVVPGTGGLAPSVSFEYSSESGNGTMGAGFAVGGLSSITRCSKNFADDGYVHGVDLTNKDSLCLDGAKLVAVSGTYGADGTEYRTRPDRRVRVRSFGGDATTGPGYFVVDTGYGIKQYYGRTYSGVSDVVTIVSGGVTKNLGWPISYARDDSQNVIHYEYMTRAAAGGELERWIAKIRYGRQNTPDRQVRFVTDVRPDASYGYRYGAPWEQTKRLAGVWMEKLVDGSWQTARSYSLAYKQETATGVSILDSIAECGSVNTECKRPTRFGWQQGAVGFQGKVKQSVVLPFPGPQPQVMTADFNGDGRLDYAYPGTTAQPWRYVLSQAAPTQAGDHFTAVLNGAPTGSSGTSTKAYAFDYNLDGAVDLMPRVSEFAPNAEPNWAPLLSKGLGASGSNFSVVPATTAFSGPLNQLADAGGALFGDFDGDGLQDNLEARYVNPATGWRYWLRMRKGVVDHRVDVNEPGPIFEPCLISTTDPCDSLAFTPNGQGPEMSFLIGGPDPEPGKLPIVDVDGDGRDEVLIVNPAQVTKVLAWTIVDSQGPAAMDAGLPASILGLDKLWADLNGDGLIDLVAQGIPSWPANQLGYWINTGRGFTLPQPMYMINPDAFRSAQVVDVNGDGRDEILFPRLLGTRLVGLDYLKSTVGTDGQLSFLLPPLDTFDAQLASLGELFTQGIRTGDVNGDGLVDIFVFLRGGSTPEGVYLYKHAGARPALLTSVRESFAAVDTFKPTVEVDYAPITDASVYSRGNCLRLQWRSCAFGAAKYVVKTVRSDAGLHGSSAQNISDYFYTSGRYDRFHGGFAGFAEQRVSSYASAGGPTRKVIVRRFFDQTEAGRTPTLTEQWRATRVQPAGQPERIAWERERFTWAKSQSPQTYFDVIDETSVDEYDFPTSVLNCGGVPDCLGVLSPAGVSQQLAQGGQQPLSSTITTVDARDTYGNVTQQTTKYGPNLSDDRTSTNWTPGLDVEAWLIHRPAFISVQDRTRDRVTQELRTQDRATVFTYMPSSSGVSGVLPKTIKRTAIGFEAVTNTYEYVADGNVKRITATSSNPVRAPRETTFAYDPHGYPHAVRNGFEDHTTYTGFNPVTGQLQVIVDPNGVGTDYAYDTLGRLVKIKTLQKPRGPSAFGVEQRFAYSYLPVLGESVLHVESKDDTGALSVRLMDRGGRIIRERFKGFDNEMRERRQSYDTFGRMTQATTYKLQDGGAQDETTNYTYDALDRLVQVSDPLVNGTSAARKWRYDGLSTVRTDSRLNEQRSTYDVRGRLIESIDAANAATDKKVRRVYGYAPFGRVATTQLEDVPNVLATRSTYTYDPFGNLLSQQDVERGTSSYQYNAFDERVTGTDASGRVRAYDYDVLGRLLSEVVTTQAGANRSRTFYTYDRIEGPNARTTLGALLRAQVTDDVAGGFQHTSDYTYDLLGRLTTRDYTLPSDLLPGNNELLHFTSTYDAQNRVKTLKFPAIVGQTIATQVTYGYAPAASSNGQLMQVSATEQLTTDASPRTTVLWKATATDSQNRLKEFQLGGLRTLNAFDWRGRMLSTEVQAVDAAAGSPPLQHFKYLYDGEGNVTQRTDAVQGAPGVGVTEYFGYDHMNRVSALSLDATKLSTAPDDSFSYDKLGNLTSSIRRGTYTFDPAKPTQVTQVNGGIVDSRPVRNYHYDVLGRQDSRPDGTLAYNDCDLQAKLIPATGAKPSATSYFYGASCQRVRRTSASESVTYAEGYERHLSRGTGEIEYRLNVGQAVLRYCANCQAP